MSLNQKKSTIFFIIPALLFFLLKKCLNMHIVQKAPFGTSSPANNMKTRILCHNLQYSYCLNGDKFNENPAIFTACFCGLQFLTYIALFHKAENIAMDITFLTWVISAPRNEQILLVCISFTLFIEA